MARLIAVLAAIVVTLNAGAETQGPQRWKMTDELRAQLRFDGLASRVRRARAISEGHQSKASENETFVVGRHDPELIMGFELMQTLVMFYRPETEFGRRVHAKWKDQGIERFGADFWNRLANTARPLLDAERANGGAADDPSGTRPCRLRAKALAEARLTFGREDFDAFLYEVIAPDTGEITSSSSDPASMVDTALWQEAGCP
jgi:hypothetical protein